MSSSQFFKTPADELLKQAEFLSKEELSLLESRKTKLVADLKEINILNKPDRDASDKLSRIIRKFHNEMGNVNFSLNDTEKRLAEHFRFYEPNNINIFTNVISCCTYTLDNIQPDSIVKNGKTQLDPAVMRKDAMDSLNTAYEMILSRIDYITVEAIKKIKQDNLKYVVDLMNTSVKPNRSCVIL